MKFIDILNTYHIMPQFSPGAMRQAENMPKDVSDADLLNRKDLTDKLIFTIDGDDAKDFDDAVSLDILENGNYCLGVHIADVTHYLTENSPLDRAAFSRGTSVYLIDTVIPMLPFELSNELCSLKPNEVRLTVSVFMEITTRGKVKSYEICNSFIKSAERMTYANVTKILDGDKDLCIRYERLIPTLRNMKRLAEILNKKRVAEGSIEFETHESKITLDSNGTPLNVERYPITISNNIIEEFMLICNVTVAKHLTSKGLPCVYRVHQRPDMMRLERLAEVLPLLGVEFPFSTDMRPKDFQKILNSADGTGIKEVVSYLLLRAMAKAKYSENNAGHFGLGFDTYCHFTSPIRRYSDVAVHRILKESLKGEMPEKKKEHFREVAVSAAVTATVTEINAAEAELEWKSVKKAEYMQDKIGEKYEGVITHVLSSGFFVELPDTVEGFVPARALEDDIYIMSENGIAMSGLKTKRTFTVGDKVKVKVAAVDAERKYIDFDVVGMSKLLPLKHKSKRKAAAGKKEKRILKEITETQREEKSDKIAAQRKADDERTLFENAVIATVYDMMTAKHKFSRDEEKFAGVTLQDMAARIASPVVSANLYDSTDFTLKAMLISASVNVKNTVKMLGDSFDFDAEDLTEDAAEYACAALRHLDKCLKYEGFNYAKREKEYISIEQKIKKRRGER